MNDLPPSFDLAALRLVIEASLRAAETSSAARITQLERERDLALARCAELSKQIRVLQRGEPDLSESPDGEGWRLYTSRNMRDEEIDYAGHRWRVITHLREGLWRIIRVDGGAVEDSVRLDRDGRPVE